MLNKQMIDWAMNGFQPTGPKGLEPPEGKRKPTHLTFCHSLFSAAVSVDIFHFPETSHEYQFPYLSQIKDFNGQAHSFSENISQLHKLIIPPVLAHRR